MGSWYPPRCHTGAKGDFDVYPSRSFSSGGGEGSLIGGACDFRSFVMTFAAVREADHKLICGPRSTTSSSWLGRLLLCSIFHLLSSSYWHLPNWIWMNLDRDCRCCCHSRISLALLLSFIWPWAFVDVGSLFFLVSVLMGLNEFRRLSLSLSPPI